MTIRSIEDDTLVAMPHGDTNGDQEYDFLDSEGADGMSDGDVAGFGAVAALLAILGSVFVARRIQ